MEKALKGDGKSKGRPRDTSEYNDGANVTHYLGNPDYSGNNLPEEREEKFNGNEAQGNDLEEEDEA